MTNILYVENLNITNIHLFTIWVQGKQITHTTLNRNVTPIIKESVILNLNWAIHNIYHLTPNFIDGHNYNYEGIRISVKI